MTKDGPSLTNVSSESWERLWQALDAVMATPVEVLQWAFRVIRGDRFVEGLLGSRLRDGSLVDALTRLRAWHGRGSATS